jgi:hypothetical protein
MNYAVIYKMMNIIGFLFLGISLFAQESKSKEEILSIVNNAPGKHFFSDDRASASSIFSMDRDYFIKKLSSSDVPVIYDLVLDKTVDYDTRGRLAKAATFLNPDKQQIDRITDYVTKNLPRFGDEAMHLQKPPDNTENMIAPITTNIPLLYKTTQNDRVLAPLRKLYEESACKIYCQIVILQKLRDTNAPQNNSLYIRILEDPNTIEMQRYYTAGSLAQAGNLESTPYLKEMAAGLFAKDDSVGKFAKYMSAIGALGIYGQKKLDANEVIKDIVTKVCNDDKANYGWITKNPANFMDLFTVLERNAGEENRKYLENLIDKGCKRAEAKEYATKALKNMSAKTQARPSVLP